MGAVRYQDPSLDKAGFQKYDLIQVAVSPFQVPVALIVVLYLAQVSPNTRSWHLRHISPAVTLATQKDLRLVHGRRDGGDKVKVARFTM